MHDHIDVMVMRISYLQTQGLKKRMIRNVKKEKRRKMPNREKEKEKQEQNKNKCEAK